MCVFLGLRSGLELIFEYNSDLYEPSTISELICRYEAILEEMVRDPRAHIDAGTTTRSANPVPSPAQPVRNDAQDRIESKLVEIWKRGFELSSISVDDDFFELGGTSLLAARLFAQMSEALEVDLPIVTLIDAPTIRQLANVIRRSATDHTPTLLVRIQNGDHQPPLFCMHGQSGNLLYYRPLAQHLGPNYPVYGLQPQGLDGKEPPLTTIQLMATRYVREIQRVQLHGPYFLAGYCMGGYLALEVAQQFRRKRRRCRPRCVVGQLQRQEYAPVIIR